MAKCNSGVLLNKIGMRKLDQNQEIDIRIRKDLPDCRRINAKDYFAVSGDVSFNKFRKPENRFECMRKGCINSGLLMMGEADETVTYRVMEDAVEFANGVVTFYVYPDGNVPATITFKIADDSALANANVFTVTVTADQVTEDGFAPVLIDFSTPPSSVDGEGWTATSSGAYIQLSADQVVGYSSIALFDALEDFELLDVVKVSCLSTVGSSADLELVEATCQESQYNDQITQIPFEMTGTKVTPNYWKLNALMGKGSSVTGYDMTTAKRTIEAYANGGANYGRITLPDINQDVCGLVAVQIADSCDATDAALTQLSVPTLIDVDEGHFQVIKNNDGTTDLIFNAALVGMDILVSYPKTATIEERVANPDFLGDTHVSIVWTKYQDDNVKIVDIFENVFITSFPMTITNETVEFAFSFAVARDDEGNFYREQRIVG